MYKLKRYHTYVQLIIRSHGKNVDYFPLKKSHGKKEFSKISPHSLRSRISILCDRSRCKVSLTSDTRSRLIVDPESLAMINFMYILFYFARFINAESIQCWCTAIDAQSRSISRIHEEWWSRYLRNEYKMWKFLRFYGELFYNGWDVLKRPACIISHLLLLKRKQWFKRNY